MDQKNTFIVSIVGVLVVAGALVWWYGYQSPKITTDTTPSTNTTVINNNSTTTTIVTPNSPDIAEIAYTQTRVIEKGKYVTTVTFTDDGFSPTIAYINRGEEVRFVNKSNLSMRIASNEFQKTPLYSGFGQEKSVGFDGKYSFIFSKAGVWGYSNMDGGVKVYGIINVR